MLAVRSLIRIQSRTLVQLATKNVPTTFSPCISHLLISQNRPELNVGIANNLKEIRDLPLNPRIIENPRPILNEIDEIIGKITELRLPTGNGKASRDGIQAARLIVIRRKKMKKHKLKKLRKKMKFAWAKIRQRREMRKEKAFQAELLGQIKEAEKFSAEAYVAEKLEKLNANPTPRYYKGKRLPEVFVRELLEKDKLKREKTLAKLERLEKLKNWKL